MVNTPAIYIDIFCNLWYNIPINADGQKRESESIMKKLVLLMLSITILMCFVACEQEHTHSFGEWSVTKNATCTEDGVKTRYCDCGEKHSDTIPANGHNYADGVCLTCDDIKEIPECRHEKVITLAGKEATCTETGLTEGKRCSECSTIIIEQTVVLTIDHIESDWIVDKDATIEETGLKHTECTMCRTIFLESIIPAKTSIGLDYKINPDGETCTVTGIGTCTDKEVGIPTHINGYKVTAIGDSAFYRCSSLTSVVIPDSVTSIGDNAFHWCSRLTSIVIPNSVTSIGYGAFRNCYSLTSIAIPDSVTYIGYYAFYDCSSLTSIAIPDSVTYIRSCAFYDCSSLTDVYYTGSEEEWKAIRIDSLGNDDLTGATIHYNYVPEN